MSIQYFHHLRYQNEQNKLELNPSTTDHIFFHYLTARAQKMYRKSAWDLVFKPILAPS